MSTKAKVQVGDRVGAISHSDGVGNIFFFGFGVYQGEQVPPFGPLGMPMEEFQSLQREQVVHNLKHPGEFKLIDDKLEYVYSEELGREPTEEEVTEYLLKNPYKNPKILLDSGDVVWGMQCWWGPEDQIKRKLKGIRVLHQPVPNAP